MADATVARLEPDRGAAAIEGEFFRCAEFLEAEGTTHSILLETAAGDLRAALPVIIREIPGSDGLMDGISPYSYPGGTRSPDATPIAADEVDWSGTGLVSVFLRDRLDGPTLTDPTARSVVLVSDPGKDRKSRMSDRQQIRKNEAGGYEVSHVAGPETTADQRREFHRVYTETMEVVSAGDRYFFEPAYFDLLFSSPLTSLFEIHGPEGDVAAAAITATSDGFLHYYLSGTANDHRRRAPSKNLIVAVTDHADELGLPMNLGGGVKPGDGLEEFKRGFANTELPFYTHELVCDRDAYERLSAANPAADTEATGFFPAYRAPAQATTDSG